MRAPPVITPHHHIHGRHRRVRPGVLHRWLGQLGPGICTGASDDDPSGIATYSTARVGSRQGFTRGGPKRAEDVAIGGPSLRIPFLFASARRFARNGTSIDMMNGSIMSSDIKNLQTAMPFDKAFLQDMIPHHQSAIAGAKLEQEKGMHPELKQLAGRIIADQQKEIDQMQTWLKTWYP